MDRSERDVPRRGVSAWEHQNPAIHGLLDQLRIEGHIISTDAMGTRNAVAAKIREKNADYLLAVKGNQRALHNELIDRFHFATTRLVKVQAHSWDLNEPIQKANGRVTTRRVAVTGSLDWMLPSIRKRWKGLARLIMTESESHEVATKKTRKQKRFHISSRVARTKEFGGVGQGGTGAWRTGATGFSTRSTARITRRCAWPTQ